MTGRPAYGSADSHGRYGILDTDDDGRLICHECGRTYDHLATHVAQAHGMTGAVYRDRHGLSTGTPLVSRTVRGRMSTAWQTHRDAHLEVLAEHRDPDRARASSTAGGRWRAELVARRMEASAARRVELTGEQVAELGDLTDLPGWADRARRLMARDGVSAAAIARAVGLSAAGVHQRLRRYPGR
ncbi:MucR family transcriptional regulator [Acidipropionibacterium timonense]|uniref:MucR family transcriptional regulator n=1 Tax=Acidipropionibacterium timonense TaxID=2161818 RepID=UPI00102FE64A